MRSRPGRAAGERSDSISREAHAGDVGDPSVLAALRSLAPVRAVRGNVDDGELTALPPALEGDIGGLVYRMTHRREDVPHPLDAFGFLIPKGERHAIMACTWVAVNAAVPSPLICSFWRCSASSCLSRRLARESCSSKASSCS